MTFRVGVIGAGAMGIGHARTIAAHVPGAVVTAVYDRDRARAARLAEAVGAVVNNSAKELIAADDVDGVVIASPDDTHPDLALACIALSKPALCEKPLATSSAEAQRVIEEEVRARRRLVQVGFMRRFDAGHLRLKTVVRSGEVGTPLLVHSVHRNPSSATSATDAGIITGSMVHELDTVPWMLDSHVEAVRIESPRTEGLRDPQLAWLYLASGAMATVEVFVNARYGYEVGCEVVGTAGTAELPPRAEVTTRVKGRRARAIHDDFISHFSDAYRHQMADWVARRGVLGADTPSAWDGFVATLVAEAGVAALTSGDRQTVDRPACPELYRLAAAFAP